MNFVLLIEISRYNEYKMKQILTSVICYWKLQYRIKWISHNDDFKWYDAWNLKNSLHAIYNFHWENFRTLSFLENLNYWLKYWKKNENAENWINNNQLVSWLTDSTNFSNSLRIFKTYMIQVTNLSVSYIHQIFFWCNLIMWWFDAEKFFRRSNFIW